MSSRKGYVDFVVDDPEAMCLCDLEIKVPG